MAKETRGIKPYTMDERIFGVEICDRIAGLRSRSGLNKTDFARKIGVRYKTVLLWETGDVVPMLLPLVRVAKEFDVSLDWLVFGKETDDEKV